MPNGEPQDMQSPGQTLQKYWLYEPSTLCVLNTAGGDSLPHLQSNNTQCN